MANAASVRVAVERAVHDALSDLAQHLFKQHGIKLNSVHFEWAIAQSLSGEMLATGGVTCVRAETETLDHARRT